MGGDGREGERRGREGKGRGGEGTGKLRPLFSNSWIRPCNMLNRFHRIPHVTDRRTDRQTDKIAISI